MRSTRRASFVLLVVSVTITLAVAFLADSSLWRLYHVSLEPAAAAFPAHMDRSADRLVVAIGRTSGGPSEWITYARVFAHVQRDLGVPIALRFVADPMEHEALVRDGETDVALLSVRAYLHIRDSVRPRLVAAPYIKGSPSDDAVLVVKSDSAFEDFDDLKGHSVAVSNDLVSTPFVEWLARKHGSTTGSYFGRVETGRVMDENLTRVSNGDVDATAVRRSALSTWPPKSFRVVEASPTFGMPPLVARKGLDPKLIDKLKDSLLTAGEEGAIPASSTIGGFNIPSESEYDFAAQMDALENEMKRSGTGSGE